MHLQKYNILGINRTLLSIKIKYFEKVNKTICITVTAIVQLSSRVNGASPYSSYPLFCFFEIYPNTGGTQGAKKSAGILINRGFLS